MRALGERVQVLVDKERVRVLVDKELGRAADFVDSAESAGCAVSDNSILRNRRVFVCAHA